MSALRQKLSAFARRHAGGSAAVLIYHRVAELERDPQLLAVTPEHFDAQMRTLARRFDVISLGDLIGELGQRRVPKNAVAVTFDDGYADNLLAAEPILSAHEVPATVFVSSGYVLNGREFWWDDLERLVLSAETLPERVDLDVAGQPYSATFEDSRSLSASEVARGRRWNVLEPPTNARQRVYLELCAFLRRLSPLERHDALEQLRGALGAPDAPARATHRPMTAAEVATLDRSRVVDVGSHTVHHPVLASLSSREQRYEIVEDSDALAAMCCRAMRVFSYPYGSLDDYTDETVRLTRDAGFLGACSNHLGVVKLWTDPFRLPRIVVRDSDTETLAENIEGWLHGER